MKRLTFALAVCLLTLGGNAWAMEKWQNWCMNGGVKVSIPGQGISTTKFMQSYPSCTVSVYDTGTSNLSTIYSDNGVTPKANPFTADSTTGYAFFYAADGTYDIKFSGTGISVPFTLSGFLLADPTSPSSSNPAVLNSIRFANDHFCTVPGVHDQTCINNAIADAPTGGLVIVPYYSDWLLNDRIVINKTLMLDCLGWNTKIKVASGFSASTDVVYVAGGSVAIEGGGVQNCQFLPQSGTPARDGLRLDTTTFSISKFLLFHNYFGTFGGKGVRLVNPSLTDGYFTSWIRNNTIFNGITMQRAGDTNVIGENVIPAQANIGVDATQVVGAMNLTIEKNNITYTTGACMHLGDAVRFPRLMNNECEGTSSTVGSNSAAVDLDGTVTNPVWQPVIFGNNIAGVATGVDGLRLNYTQSPYVDGNIIFRAGSAKDITITANTTGGSATITCGNYYSPNSDTQTNIISDSGSSNICWNSPYSQVSQGGIGAGQQFTRKVATPEVWTSAIIAPGSTGAFIPPTIGSDTNLVGTTSTQTMSGKTFSDLTTFSAGLNANSAGITNIGAASGVTTLSMSGQLTNTLSTGTAPLVITSTTPVAHLTTVPTAYNHSGTQQTAYHLVQDTCTLGTDCGVTLAGSAVYTSSTSYTCTCQDETAIGACKVAQSSGSAFTVTGTGTDVIRYQCGGN